MKHDKRITVRLPESDKKRLEDEAKGKGLGFAQYLRKKLGIKE